MEQASLGMGMRLEQATKIEELNIMEAKMEQVSSLLSLFFPPPPPPPRSISLSLPPPLSLTLTTVTDLVCWSRYTPY